MLNRLLHPRHPRVMAIPTHKVIMLPRRPAAHLVRPLDAVMERIVTVKVDAVRARTMAVSPPGYSLLSSCRTAYAIVCV